MNEKNCAEDARRQHLLNLIREAKRKAYFEPSGFSIWLCRGAVRFRVESNGTKPTEADQVVWIVTCGRDPDPSREFPPDEDELFFIGADGNRRTFGELVMLAIDEQMKIFDLDELFEGILTDLLCDPMCDPEPVSREDYLKKWLALDETHKRSLFDSTWESIDPDISYDTQKKIAEVIAPDGVEDNLFQMVWLVNEENVKGIMNVNRVEARNA